MKPRDDKKMKKETPPTTEKVEKEVRKDLPAATVDKNRAAMFSPIGTKAGTSNANAAAPKKGKSG